jgi:hypothetical protein
MVHHKHGMVAMTIGRDLTAQWTEPPKDDPAMKSETPAQKYRREAEKCQLSAAKAVRTVDREAWLRLAADWTKLAESAELNPLLDKLRS